MKNNWQSRLIRQMVGLLPPSSSPTPSISEVLTDYQKSLNELKPDEQSLLALLLVRDRVEDIFHQTQKPTLDQVQQLVTLDTHLRQRATGELLRNLSKWRDSLHPPESHWWWTLDKALTKREQEKDLLWELIAVTLFVLTVPLVTDMIKRLWANVPNNFAILSSLLLLLVTASPFTSRGRELMQWLLKRIPQLPSHRRPEVMAITALAALLLVAAGRFLFMPRLAVSYNDNGVAALEEGNLTAARQQFQRAVAINNDFAVSYYNLAVMHEAVAQTDEAISLYQQALAYNLEFSPAYNNLGRIFLQQNQPEKALSILQAGLSRLENVPPGESPPETAVLTRYRLLTHLGQAYYELGEMETAVTTLTQATTLEEDEDTLDPAFLSARPHYYLALTYEKLEYPPNYIIVEWESALSYLAEDDPIKWDAIIRTHLETWRQNNS